MWDVLVIGSGFGGAVAGTRLAERGAKVLVLERGRWWDAAEGKGRSAYPRGAEDPWIWNQDRPEQENGWMDFRPFPDMAVVQGAAVGGGSQIYANISTDPPEHAFQAGWPKEVNLAVLRPHLDRVARTMKVREVPAAQWPARTHLMKEAAEAAGHGPRFQPLELAVTFNDDLKLGPDEVLDPEKAAKEAPGTCVHCGSCDIGCSYGARNTLDRTYLPLGMSRGMDVRPLHLVRAIEPVADGYRVRFDRIEGGRLVPGEEVARKVVVSAGSLGSTELLLRCRDEFRSLPRLSPRLGEGWCSNGDFLTPAVYERRKPHPTHGPTITSAITFQDGSQGPRFWIEDGGFFNLFSAIAHRRAKRPFQGGGMGWILDWIASRLVGKDPFAHVMPWFAQGVDSPDGAMRLRRRWGWFGRRRLHLDWDVTRSIPVIEAIVAMHKKLSEVTGGTPFVPPTWTLAKNLITPHPLGGCGMGTGPQDGVVDHRGEVFGYPGLFVTDGSVIPRPLGVNPSRTIGALAERTAGFIGDDLGLPLGQA